MDGFSMVGRGGKLIKEPAPVVATEQQRSQAPAQVSASGDGHFLFLGPPASKAQIEQQPELLVKFAGTDVLASNEIFNNTVVVVGRPAAFPGMRDICVVSSETFETALSARPLTLLQVTSSRGGTLFDKHARSQKTIACCVPLNGATHQDSSTNPRYEPLTFVTGVRLEKPSYVNAGQVYRVDLSLLSPHKLAPTSLRALMLTDESIQRLLALRKEIDNSKA
nr:hypothetical protein B0A51_14217 [Rachicladosporium sp. CCFEE 5018]